jgi:uncharacterized protein YjbI with pentapeptide repeats
MFEQDEYTGETFSGLDKPDLALSEVSFYECVFEACTFREAQFKRCKFHECTFRQCDLSLIDVTDCSFIAAQFDDSQVIGVNWALALWDKAGFLNSVAFKNCALTYSTFIGLTLHEFKIIDCVARDVDFSEAVLKEADFSGTDLSQSRFVETDLSGADLSKARNYSIDATLNTLKGAKFSLPEAMALLYSLDIVIEE